MVLHGKLVIYLSIFPFWKTVFGSYKALCKARACKSHDSYDFYPWSTLMLGLPHRTS